MAANKHPDAVGYINKKQHNQLNSKTELEPSITLELTDRSFKTRTLTQQQIGKFYKIKSIAVVLHQWNGPFNFCFHPELPEIRQAPGATCCLSESHCMVKNRSCLQRILLSPRQASPSSLHPSLSLPAAVAAAVSTAAQRENLHFNRQSCTPSPNEGMCSGKQQEMHPAAQVSNEPSTQFLGQ